METKHVATNLIYIKNTLLSINVHIAIDCLLRPAIPFNRHALNSITRANYTNRHPHGPYRPDNSN